MERLEEKVIKAGYRKIDSIKNAYYYINKQAKVIKIVLRKGGYIIKDVKISDTAMQEGKFNIVREDGKVTSMLVSKAMYETFKGDVNYSTLVHIDGDSRNSCLDNLISVEELLNYYKKNNDYSRNN